MHLINQTFLVDDTIVATWLEWLKNDYIPEVMTSGNFASYKILKLITGGSEDGATFSLQFCLTAYNNLYYALLLFDQTYECKIAEKFGEKVLFFRSVLEEIIFETN